MSPTSSAVSSAAPGSSPDPRAFDRRHRHRHRHRHRRRRHHPPDATDHLWSTDPYTILRVPRSVTDAQLKQAYHRLTLIHHPDRAHSDQDRLEREKRQRQLNLAYRAIKEDNARASRVT
ncbi:MAG: J domain-containing protein [Nannocystis sp.]|nr:J domain-containing protein [Nannocystis sp.]